MDELRSQGLTREYALEVVSQERGILGLILHKYIYAENKPLFC